MPDHNAELACRLCGDVIVWAQGIRWVRSEGRLVDQRHLIRADNGLHPDICPRSEAVDPVHQIDDHPSVCSFALHGGVYCQRPAGHEKGLRVTGHHLVSEGAPFERVVDEHARIVAKRLNHGGVAGEGRALCSCKAMSDVLPSGGARQRWHREHKQGVRRG